MEKILSLAKNRGFVFQGSEIYGGLANTWDYGPLGIELKNNIKKAWWKKFIQESPYNVGLDAAIFMNPRTWEASGHVGNFSDPMLDCKVCKSRLRADKLIEEYYFNEKNEDIIVDGLPFEELEAIIERENIKCPECGGHDFTNIRQFNLMFKTNLKQHKVFSLTLKMFNVVCVKNYHLVLDKLVNHSVMRLHQVTLFSEQENSNKWN